MLKLDQTWPSWIKLAEIGLNLSKWINHAKIGLNLSKLDQIFLKLVYLVQIGSIISKLDWTFPSYLSLKSVLGHFGPYCGNCSAFLNISKQCLALRDCSLIRQRRTERVFSLVFSENWMSKIFKGPRALSEKSKNQKSYFFSPNLYCTCSQLSLVVNNSYIAQNVKFWDLQNGSDQKSDTTS